jgi:putative transposase
MSACFKSSQYRRKLRKWQHFDFAMPKRKRPKRYPTDLNARKWNVIRELLPAALPGGRPRKTSLRKILNAVFYVVRSGCAWRLLPMGHFPAYQTVYGYFRRWVKDGTWERVHDTLRADVRRKAGRHL